MRILLLGLNFWPELTGIGKYSGEMAAWLAARGHAVRVITAPPYYPQWRVASPYVSWAYRREALPQACVEGESSVLRCPLYVPRRPSGLRRMLHLGSFAVAATPPALMAARWRPDLVWTVEPTLVLAPLALAVARLSGAASWLHVQDFEVDAARDLGLLPDGGALRTALKGEAGFMGRFDCVSTISDRMLERLREKGVSAEKRVLFPNWVDTGVIHPLGRPSALRQELGLPANAVVALYSGNMGAKQGLELLVDATRRLAPMEDLHFVFCGSGSEAPGLKASTAGLERVHWLPLQPFERLNELLNLADIHLLPQRADAADLVMPSKLTGMFASGGAVLATAAQGTELAQVLDGRGVIVPPGDDEAFAQALSALAQDPARRAALGAAGRSYAQDQLDREPVLLRFEARARQIVARRAGLSGEQ